MSTQNISIPSQATNRNSIDNATDNRNSRHFNDLINELIIQQDAAVATDTYFYVGYCRMLSQDFWENPKEVASADRPRAQEDNIHVRVCQMCSQSKRAKRYDLTLEIVPFEIVFPGDLAYKGWYKDTQ